MPMPKCAVKLTASQFGFIYCIYFLLNARDISNGDMSVSKNMIFILIISLSTLSIIELSIQGSRKFV